MDNVKIIDLSSNKKQKLSKKQFYNDLLSNTEKVKEIINRKKKTKRFDYLNTIPLKKNRVELNEKKLPKEIPSNPSPKNKNVYNFKCNSPTNSSKLIKPNAKYVSFKEPQTNKPTRPAVNLPKTNDTKEPKLKHEHELKQKGIDNYFKPISPKPNIMKSPNNRANIKKQKPNIMKSPNNRPKINKQQHTKRKSPNIRKSTQKQHKNVKRLSNPKTFTQEQLIYIIKVMYKLNELEDILRIHKLIRRLNKIQINQCLFALRLIKKNSNAPIAMLKNSLFNYITANIIIS